jgi:hypothetical protein
LSQKGSRSGFTAERYLIDGRERGDNGQLYLSQMRWPFAWVPYEAAHLLTVTSDKIRQHAGERGQTCDMGDKVTVNLPPELGHHNAQES